MADGTAQGVVLVVTSFPASGDAGAFVAALVEQRLVACGTLLAGARSIYRWSGAVADESETVVLLKTARDRLDSLTAAFASLHPYAVPELLVVGIEEGLSAYLRWVWDETRPATTS